LHWDSTPQAKMKSTQSQFGRALQIVDYNF
jgi:hypothetical protein